MKKVIYSLSENLFTNNCSGNVKMSLKKTITLFFKTILEKHMTFKYGQYVVEALCYKLQRAVFKPGHLLSIISRLL